MHGMNLPRVYLAGAAAGGFCALVQIIAWALGAYHRLGQALGPTFLEAANRFVGPVLALEVFVGGPLAMWLYAAIRPRFGAGPRTAVIAGSYIWIVMGPYGLSLLYMGGLLTKMSVKLLVVLEVSMLPLVVAALLIGGFLYREEEPARAAANA